MPLQATSGAASYDAFGGGVAAVPNYIEDVFSTYLWTGTSAARSINNGIDLSTKGGMVWIKDRTVGNNNVVFDTARGASKLLITNQTGGQSTDTATLTSFNTNGFSVDYYSTVNESPDNYVGWTFRKQPKFFDVVTWTGDSTAGRQITHSLGSVPGSIFVKITNAGGDWWVYHRSIGATGGLNLNGTSATITSSALWNDTSPTSTVFTLGGSPTVNGSGYTYVAYLFAHNAGGFGLTGTDNVISCGSYTGNGSTDGPVIDLGYEPQWLLIKSSSASSTAWMLFDNMRGMTVGGADAYLKPNSSDAETTSLDLLSPTATGFKLTSTLGSVNGANDYIYIAIRRGPMKVPTSGTSVFAQTSTTSSTTPLSVTTNFPVDMAMNRYSGTTSSTYVFSRLTGAASDGTRESVYLQTNSTAAETAPNAFGDSMVSNTALIDYAFLAGNSNAKIYWNFQRAPSFFDEVCYTGTGTTTTQTHNLQVVPELIIVKRRSGVAYWQVYSATYGRDYYAFLNDTQGFASDPGNSWGTTNPTSTTFSLSPTTETNASGSTYVAYLFATAAGVSKVGSYTGTGTTKQVDCGFTGGARFVLIKKTSGTGSWYVWDSARGIVSGNDPYLLLNSTAAEVTSTDYIDTYSAGFEISSTAPSEINESGGSFIFLAIA